VGALRDIPVAAHVCDGAIWNVENDASGAQA